MRTGIVPAVRFFGLVVLVLLAAGNAPLGAQDSLPAMIDLGAVKAGTQVTSTVTVANDTEAVLFIEFLPTCECLTTEPGDLTLNPGASGNVKISFDSTGYGGEVVKDLRLRSSDRRYHGKKLTVRADVEGVAAAEKTGVPCTTCKEIEHLEAMKQLSTVGNGSLLFGELFYSEGCRECEAFLADEYPSIEKTSRLPVFLKLRNIMDDADFAVFLERTQALGVEIEKFPTLIMNGKTAEGVPAIARLLTETIAAINVTPPDGSTAAPVTAPDTAKTVLKDDRPRTGIDGAVMLGFIPVFTAGLVDGINPCAFSTLIFLISALTVYGRTRKEVLTTGIVFAASVFVTYYLVGLGAFTAIRSAAAFPVIAASIRWILIAVLFAFAALSVYDGIMASTGRNGSILLQLPLSMKRRIHRTVHTGMRSASLLAGTIGMGVLVSVFELACTGQVYLPTITWMVAEGRTSAFGLLAIYNTAFILPLLGVFFLAYSGISSKKLAEVFSSNMAAVKFLLAGAFAALGVLTILL